MALASTGAGAASANEVSGPHSELPRSVSHPFHEKLNQTFDDEGFDSYVEDLCQDFYDPVLGRPSISPGI